MNTNPSHGARFRLVRQQTAGDQAHYEAVIAAEGGRTHTFDAHLDRSIPSAALSLRRSEPEGETPTEDELRFLTTLARTVARGAGSQQAWPRWINRWRAGAGDPAPSRGGPR